MAEKKTAQVSTTVSAEEFAALRKYRFQNEIDKMTDVVKTAVQEFIVNHKIEVPKAAEETPAADPKTEKAPAKA